MAGSRTGAGGRGTGRAGGLRRCGEWCARHGVIVVVAWLVALIALQFRVHEAWLRTGDAKGAVAHALEITARVITCAALIMVSVFAAFVVSDNIVVKMLGLGLAVSVLIDATVVRLLLVPAVMTLLGRHAWWAPRWLDRILPHIDAEGEHARNLSARAGAKE
jgi:RND superfamily putative drug exporter